MSPSLHAPLGRPPPAPLKKEKFLKKFNVTREKKRKYRSESRKEVAERKDATVGVKEPEKIKSNMADQFINKGLKWMGGHPSIGFLGRLNAIFNCRVHSITFDMA